MTAPILTTRPSSEILLYQAEDGRTRVEVRFEGETAWLTLAQMADLFQRDKSVIPATSRTSSTRGSSRRAQLLQVLQQLRSTAGLVRSAG